MKVLPLTPDRLPDLAALFEQGGDPKWCWCAYFRIRGFDFSSGGKARHRAVMEEAVVETAKSGARPGWSPTTAMRLSAGSASGHARITSGWPTRRSSSPSMTSRSGRSSASLSDGVRAARGWPDAPRCGHHVRSRARRDDARGVPGRGRGGRAVPSADLFRGTLAMFERAGFEVVARRSAPGSRTPRPIVRRLVDPR